MRRITGLVSGIDFGMQNWVSKSTAFGPSASWPVAVGMYWTKCLTRRPVSSESLFTGKLICDPSSHCWNTRMLRSVTQWLCRSWADLRTTLPQYIWISCSSQDLPPPYRGPSMSCHSPLPVTTYFLILHFNIILSAALLRLFNIFWTI